MAIADNLVAYWKLDEASGSRADSYGSETLTDNGTHGRVTGPGNLSYAASFTDNNTFQKNSDAALVNTGNFTIAGWFKTTSLGAGQYPSLMGKSPAAVEWTLGFNGDNMSLSLGVSPDGSNITWAGSSALSNGVWYFLTAWYDGGHIYISINDAAPTSSVYSSGIYSGTAPFYIGWSFSGIGLAIAGVAFWKRALTSAERTWLYNGGNGRANYLAPAAPAASTLPKFTSTGNGAQKQIPAALSTIAKLTSAGVAKQAQAATAASTIAKLTSLGAVTTPPPGWAGESTLPKLTSAATALQLQTAAAASSLPKLTSAATAAQIFKGIGGSTLRALTSLGGVVMVPRGAGASAIPMLRAAGVGNIPMSGPGASTLPMLTSLGGVLIVTIGTLPHIHIGGGYPVSHVRIHGGVNTSGVRLSGGFFV